MALIKNHIKYFILFILTILLTGCGHKDHSDVGYRTVILEGHTLNCVDHDIFDNQIEDNLVHYCNGNFNNYQFNHEADTPETVTVAVQEAMSGRSIYGNIGKIETSNIMFSFVSYEYVYKNNYKTCEDITPDTLYDDIDRNNKIENAGYRVDNAETNIIYFYDENGPVDIRKYKKQYQDIVDNHRILGDEYYLAILSWIISPYAGDKGLMDNRELVYNSPFLQKHHDRNEEIYDAMLEYLCNEKYITESSAIEVLAYADLYYKVRREEIKYFYEDVVYPDDDGTVYSVHHYLCQMQGNNYVYRQYDVTLGEAMDIVCDRWEPLGTATIYMQDMVETDEGTYYHFIVSELNDDYYDEIYIDTDTGRCRDDVEGTEDK